MKALKVEITKIADSSPIRKGKFKVALFLYFHGRTLRGKKKSKVIPVTGRGSI
jgi:hypothetical protein